MSSPSSYFILENGLNGEVWGGGGKLTTVPISRGRARYAIQESFPAFRRTDSLRCWAGKDSSYGPESRRIIRITVAFSHMAVASLAIWTESTYFLAMFFFSIFLFNLRAKSRRSEKPIRYFFYKEVHVSTARRLACVPLQ